MNFYEWLILSVSREVTYERLNKIKYFTLSKKGITYWTPSENSFTNIKSWYDDYHKYCEVVKVSKFNRG